MSSCDEYSDNEPYSSDENEGEYEYEIPLCFCGKDAKLRISGTEKNYLRRFFNCAKRKFNNQCGFFVWEDELFSDESGDESSFICDECLEKERENDEIESSRNDGKASWDREKQPLIDKVKDEPLDQDGPSNDTLLFVKVKDEPLDQDCPANDTPLIVKVKDETLDQGGPTNDAPLIYKVKEEPLDQGGSANDDPLSDKVKDEPLDQDGDRSRDKAESVCVKCLTLKRRVDEIKSGRDENKEKGEMLTKLETAESELCQLKKETEDADDKPLSEKLSVVESELGQISKKTKLANKVDHMPLFDKLSNSENENHIKKKTKLANVGCDVSWFEMLSNSQKETAVSELLQIRKTTELANEASEPSFSQVI